MPIGIKISEQPLPNSGGCSTCQRDIATPYKDPDNGPQCAACYRRRKRLERGHRAPGPAPDPTKERSRYGEARKNEGTRDGVVGRPRRTDSDAPVGLVRKNSGEGVVRTFATSTHCANGHLWETAGFYFRADFRYDGGQQKVCRLCQRAAFQKSKGRAITPDTVPVGPKNGDKTHCAHDHEYNERNTGRNPDGSRYCRRCVRNNRILSTYGLSPEQWDAMLIEQAGRCDICTQALVEPHVDHNHASGAVRSLLCTNCNNGLGRFDDDPVRLRAAADYIERYAQPR
jgi:hypothetical protein